MKFSIATALLAAAFALTACDRNENPAPRSAATGSSATAGSTQGPKDTSAVQTPNSPANLPKPSEAERDRESNKPQQGQVDPKQPEQTKDFKRN